MYDTIWTFRTKNFTVRVMAEPDYTDLDLSWDDTGEVRAKIESGEFTPYTIKAAVEFNGIEIGADYLGQSIYADISEFRDHIGMNARGHGSYFSDMVREAIANTRKSLANVPHLRAA